MNEITRRATQPRKDLPAMERRRHALTRLSAHYLALLLSGLALASVPRAAWSAEPPASERAPAALFEAAEPDLYQAKGAYVRTELRFTFDLPSTAVGDEPILGDTTRRGPRVPPPSAAVGDEPIQVFIHGTSSGVFTRAWSWWDGVKRVIPVDTAGLRKDNDASCLMSTDPKAFRVLGKAGLPTSPAGWTASAIADGRLFIRMSGPMEGLACYDLREESK